MSQRIAIFDPAGRLAVELAPAIAAFGGTVEPMPGREAPRVAAVLIAPAAAADLGPPPDGSPVRWIVGDGGNAGRVAGAAASAGAIGVLLTPVSPEGLAAAITGEATSTEFDLARARGLIATSLVDLTHSAADALHALAEGFGASDCIVWWRDGDAMTPTASRPDPVEGYRTQIAGAARIAAASTGTVILGGTTPRAVIAEALRSSPTEVSGLVAIVADKARRFTAAERTDLKAIAVRLTRELSWLSSHRRLVAEGERLMASSLHDPLTGAMTRGAFEQTITHEVAAAGRRNEQLTIAVVDVVGLRRINLAHGHKVGDEVLAQVAGRLRAGVRGNDTIGRLGGDELAIVLVGATDDQAALVVRKLIHRIQSEPIRVDEASVAVEVRAVVSEIATGERSGEAALARCYASLRAAPIGDVRVVAPDERIGERDEAADSGLSAGTIVGGTYRVLHELSRGAMGVVYRGEDLGLGRQVAIKVLRSDLASDRELVARFRAEAGILASLHHENLVQVFALGEHGGDVYFVMELVEGQPLSEVLRSTIENQEWFPIPAITQIAVEIADALDAMHALGLIHRDVKPANVLLDRERDRAVLVDVGVAVKAGDRREAAGTPGFAAPESFLESADGPTTDVYGLAATVYCMLTGRPPFGSGPAPQVVHRQLNDALIPPSQLRPSLSTAVDEVLSKALSPSAKKRWASASTFATALGRALERLVDDSNTARTGVIPVTTPEAVLAPTAALTGGDLRRLPSSKIGRALITGRVRAAHTRVLSRILQHHLGEAGLTRIVGNRPELASALAPTTAPLSWVDLLHLVGLLERAREVLPATPLIARQVGRGTMSATFARMFGADPASVPTEIVLGAAPTFWPRYHDWGPIEVAVQPGRGEVILHGYSGSPEVCTLVGAELERVLELTGAGAVALIHTRCACRGDEHCAFDLTWTPTS